MSSGIPPGFNNFHTNLVLRGSPGMSVRIPSGINQLCADLVLRVPQHHSAQNYQEGRTQRLELLLGDVPRQPIQRRPHRCRSRPLRALLEPPPAEVVRISRYPLGLRGRSPLAAAHKIKAGDLPPAYPRVRSKPAPTEPARAFLLHPSMLDPAASSALARPVHSWRAHPGHSS